MDGIDLFKVAEVLAFGSDFEVTAMLWFYAGDAADDNIPLARRRMAGCYELLAERHDKRNGIRASVLALVSRSLARYLRYLAG